jgi:flagellar basal-body rod protein FlgB
MSYVQGLFSTDLQFYRQVLNLRAYRQQILTADIANASTPGFKAVDLDFSAALDAATGGPTAAPQAGLWLVDDPRQLDPGTGGEEAALASAVKYQTGAPVTLDGNSVDLNREKVAAAENAIQYEAATSFASQMIKLLTVAIGASGPQPTAGG